MDTTERGKNNNENGNGHAMILVRLQQWEHTYSLWKNCITTSQLKKKKIQSNNNTEVLSKTAMSISENVLQLLFPEA